MIRVLTQSQDATYDCTNFYCVGKEIRTAFTPEWFEILGRYPTEIRAKGIVSLMFDTHEKFIMPEK